MRLALRGRLPRRRHRRVPLRARASGRFSFMEVNARLQVEHPVTEMPSPGSTSSSSSSTSPRAAGSRASRPPRVGHAIEARLNAEDPALDFAPAPGPRRAPAAARPARACGSTPASPRATSIPAEFDSMIAKLIAWGARPRRGARAPAARAGARPTVVLEGGTTNQGFLLELLDRPEVRAGEVDTTWLDRLRLARRDRAGAPRRRRADPGGDRARTTPRPRVDRARFYAFARRGRPQADAAIARTVELRHRGHALPLRASSRSARSATASTSTAPRRGRASSALERARAPARRRRRAPTARVISAQGARPAGRGRRRAAPRRARRRRRRAQPRARRSWCRSRSRRATRSPRRRRRRASRA